MKRIISQELDSTNEDEGFENPADFTDVEMRRFDGAVSESIYLLQQAQNRLSEIRAQDPRIDYYRAREDKQLSFLLRQTGFMISGYLKPESGDIKDEALS